MNIFSALTSKIFGGLALALLIYVGILNWQNGNLKEEVKERDRLVAECNAAREVQNVGIERQRVEGVLTRQAFEKSVADGNALLRDARAQRVVVTRTVRNGCPTPAVIMGAGL